MPASVTTIASFLASAKEPDGALFADASGDLLGATVQGGTDSIGTIYEIAKTGASFSAPATLGSVPPDLNTLVGVPNISADASGDVFGLEIVGGVNQLGAIVEFPNAGGGPTTLANFSGTSASHPGGRLLVDASGNLFGTTLSGGVNGAGTVFELQKTGATYAATPTILTSFGAGITPSGSSALIQDASGNLFGSTTNAVFEVKKTGATYSTPTILVPFPVGTQIGGLVIDAKGDIFGTTVTGGANGDGTVFEIEKTATGYASTPTTLASFAASDGQLSLNRPKTLIVDANGDLFGTTDPSAQNSGGIVFEIVRISNGYESTPRVVVNFNGGGNDGALGANLVADASGDLFVTQSGGTSNAGTALEITGSGFATTPTITPVISDLFWQNRDTGQGALWEMDGITLIGGGPITPNPGTSWTQIGTGDFNDDDHSDILWQNPTTGQASIWEMDGNSLKGGGKVTPNPGPNWTAIGTGDFTGAGFADDILWQNTVTGQASIWEMDGTSLMGGGPVTPNPGTAWKAIGSGDFNGDGKSDILWQNTNTGQVSVWEMNGNSLIGGGPVSTNPGPAWQAIGSGHFNQDAFADILLQNKNTGAVSAWEMDGNSLMGGGPVANPGTNWHAIGTGAGGSDILLQNISGQTSIWEMNGSVVAGGGPVTPLPGPTWRAVALS